MILHIMLQFRLFESHLFCREKQAQILVGKWSKKRERKEVIKFAV